METDIPKTTIAILLVLAIVISILGTFAVMNATSDVSRTGQPVQSSNSAGQVHVQVVTPEDLQEQTSTGSATISLEVK